jgi:hypothetical protein
MSADKLEITVYQLPDTQTVTMKFNRQIQTLLMTKEMAARLAALLLDAAGAELSTQPTTFPQPDSP